MWNNLVEYGNRFFELAELFVGMVLSLLVPTNNDVVVFHEYLQGEFASNSKYLFLYLTNHTDKECIWITASDEVKATLPQAGFDARKSNTIGSKISSLRGGYHVTSYGLSRRYHMYSMSGQKVLLWHGIPLKQLGERKLGQMKKIFGGYDHACITGDIEASELKKGRYIKEINKTGYPRNDVLKYDLGDKMVGVDRRAQSIIDNIPKNKTLIGYFPTYRPYSVGSDPIKADKTNDFLESVESHLIVKSHMALETFPEKTNVDDPSFNNITLVASEGDLYPLLNEVDILITDYSSIYFDYLFIDNPIVFYPFDFDRYKKDTGFNLEYEHYTPGPKAYNHNELLEELGNVIERDEYETRRKEVLKEVFAHRTGKASSRIRNQIFL